MTMLWAFSATIPPTPSPAGTGADGGAPFSVDAGILAAVISAAVAIIVAFITPALQSWRQRRDAVHAKFDAAVVALLDVQGARHYPDSIGGVRYPGTSDQRAEFERQTVERFLTRFMTLTSEAKTALATIAPYVPEARTWVTAEWEIREDAEPAMREVIEKARAKAVKTERFLRMRATVG